MAAGGRGAARPFKRTRFGAYELLAPLAVGGTAEIFLARWTSLGVERIVVVKQLLPEHENDEDFGDMFLDEARLGAQINHPNIVQTYEMGTVGDRRFIVMEYLAGLTLGQVAAKARARGGLPVEIAVAVVAQAAMGLHHAHEVRQPDGQPLKIVHRDVSPQNLIVTFNGETKVVDFGIAHAAVREARTRTGTVKGKFAYMPPEQVAGKTVDRRTDVFALGVVLWECLTGQRLFKRKSTYETYRAIVAGNVQPPGVDPALDRIVMTALARAPESRFPTAQALAETLQGWLRRPVDLRAFVQSVFAAEVREHDRRMAEILAGSTQAPPVERWDRDESEPKAGPEDATVLAPSSQRRPARGPALVLLAIAAFVVVLAAVIHWLAG